ncbi:MAG: ribonuclease III [Actinobacteria bacterium]|nr:ribonuclease III [Actinomycetota bacterium]
MSLTELQERLGVEITPELLQLAVTHSSYAYEKGGADNERLEFLGDSILGYLVAVSVFKGHQELSEGELTKLKNAVVSAQALATAATALDLGKYLRLGKGEAQTDGRKKPNILADAFEAILGAAYLSSGIEAARAVVEKFVLPLLDNPDAIREMADPKTSLIEKAQKLGLGLVRYQVSGDGPDHQMTYTANCFIGEDLVATGISSTKRSAETEAAIEALKVLSKNA